MFNSTWVDQWSGAGISDNEVIDRGVLKPYHVSRCNQTGGAHIYLEAHRKHHQHFSKAVDDKIVVYKDPDIPIGYDENMVLEEEVEKKAIKLYEENNDFVSRKRFVWFLR